VSEGVIQSGGVLRVMRFGVARSSQSLDPAMRDAMRSLIAAPGLIGAWFGRRTTETGEERALVSVWRSADEAAGASIAGLELGESAEVVLPIAFDIRIPRAVRPAILRLYDGSTLPGQLDAYVEDAEAATRLDVVRPGGPLLVCMALDRPDRFVTASVWSDWASLETYTGGDIDQPLVSRNRARLAGGGPSHYEIVASG
jgi:hypothetical protein